jgi:pimeloyl-ACP methyl ester carboxylesterase
MKKSATVPAAVNLRRAYFECRHGQLHVRTAFPCTGGFDERTPLLCLHRSPLSSRSFVPFLPELGTDRSVYALDTPGHGESDPLAGRQAPPTIADYAAATGEFLDALRLREVDVLGHQAGAAIAAELALARPAQVRRLVLVSVPVHTAQERDAFDAQPWPLPPAEDGGHLLREWQRSVAARGPGVTLAQLAAGFADKLHNGAQAQLGIRAAYHWPAADRLRLVRQPALVLRPKDELWEATARARPLLAGAEWQELPDHGGGLFGVAPGPIAARVRRFLDR